MKNNIFKIIFAIGVAVSAISCKVEKWTDLHLTQTEVYVITPTSGDVYQYSLYYDQEKLLVWSGSEIIQSDNSIKEFVDRSSTSALDEKPLYDFEFVEITKKDDIITEYKYEVVEQSENVDIVDVKITNLTDNTEIIISDAKIEKLTKNI